MKRILSTLLILSTLALLLNACTKDMPKDTTRNNYTAEFIDHDMKTLPTELQEISAIYYKSLNVAGSPFIYFGPLEQCDIRAVNCCKGAEKYVERYLYDHEYFTAPFTFVVTNKDTGKELYRYSGLVKPQ